MPVADPTAILFGIYWTEQPRSLKDAQAWIDRYWNIATSTHIVLDEDGEWFSHLAREIDAIYDAHTASVHKVIESGLASD
jgi:hypothetical protein